MLAEAFRDKSKKGKETARILLCLDENLSICTIQAYLERCKFKYVLAFLQWRCFETKAKQSDLREIFDTRVQILVKCLKSAQKGKFKHHIESIENKQKNEFTQHPSSLQSPEPEGEDHVMNKQEI